MCIINLYNFVSFFYLLVAAKDAGEYSEVVLVDHTGVVLVQSHHHTHRSTEQCNIAVLNVAHQTALEHQFPGGLKCAGQAVQGQLHPATGSLDQDSKAGNDAVEKVIPVALALSDPAQPAWHVERAQDIDGQKDAGSECRLDVAVGGLFGVGNDALVLEYQCHNL